MARSYDLLFDPNVGGALDADGYLELCRAAGYSEEEAQRAATTRANRRLDKELTP